MLPFFSAVRTGHRLRRRHAVLHGRGAGGDRAGVHQRHPPGDPDKRHHLPLQVILILSPPWLSFIFLCKRRKCFKVQLFWLRQCHECDFLISLKCLPKSFMLSSSCLSLQRLKLLLRVNFCSRTFFLSGAVLLSKLKLSRGNEYLYDSDVQKFKLFSTIQGGDISSPFWPIPS